VTKVPSADAVVMPTTMSRWEVKGQMGPALVATTSPPAVMTTAPPALPADIDAGFRRLRRGTMHWLSAACW
jgi:hypothetical protein